MSSYKERGFRRDAVKRTMSLNESFTSDLIGVLRRSEDREGGAVDTVLISLNELAKERFVALLRFLGMVSAVSEPFETGIGEVHVPRYRGHIILLAELLLSQTSLA